MYNAPLGASSRPVATGRPETARDSFPGKRRPRNPRGRFVVVTGFCLLIDVPSNKLVLPSIANADHRALAAAISGGAAMPTVSLT